MMQARSSFYSLQIEPSNHLEISPLPTLFIRHSNSLPPSSIYKYPANMKFTSSLLVLLPLLTASVAKAAECANYQGDMSQFIKDHEDMLWGLRQQMCGDGACGNQQQCTLTANSKDGGATLYRKDVQYNYANCWVCESL